MSDHSAAWDGEPGAPLAVILTALQLECRAVIAHLELRHDRTDRHGTVYTCGLFRTPDRCWRVAVAECGAGNHRAQAVATYAITHFDPHAILFVGVAGSLKADVPLGDVVASTKIYNYHSGKAESEFLPRPQVENTNFELEQLARGVARADAWRNRITERHPDQQKEPGVHVGPIAAGEQVDADARSDTHKLIKRFYSDALAVEMEGYGTLTAANIPRVPAIVVRGISDNVVDKAECDGKGWQPFAAHTSAAFAFELLANYRVTGPNPPVPLGPVRGGIPAAPNPPSPPVSGTDAAADLRGAVRTASVNLLAWPTDLGRGEWLLRPELRTIRDRIDNAPHSTTLVLGAPGSGKSALLARLGHQLEEQGIPALAIKADLLPEEVRDSATLGEHLGLGVSAEVAVRGLAADGKVAVLIDQLDALAGVVDLRPGRLNALLSFVRAIDGVPNVHVVCSCREFERQRDARLRAVEADVTELSLPTWEQVVEVLKGRGVNPEGWPEAFRELLRPPQHLKVFLQGLSDPSEVRVFTSYQQMLDDLWTKRVTDPNGPVGRSDLLLDLSTHMAEGETLWVPEVRFEERSALVEALVGAGVLTRASSGAGLGFSHQTLFEHAWARAFARQRCSLADYTVARQHGLFVRSTLWASLIYLRGADPAGCRREFGRLWRRSDLRTHIRHMLVEFLGTDPAPDVQEETWLTEALNDPSLTPRALLAVRGNPAWFQKLLNSHLPRLARTADVSSGALVGVLAAAGQFARTECLELVRREWLPDTTKDLLTFHLLTQLPTADASTVDVACQLIRRTSFNRSAVMHLTSRVSDSVPDLAPRLVAAALDRELDELEQQVRVSRETEEPPEGEALARRLLTPSREGVRRILESNDWYGAEEVAERGPSAFLREVWPRFIRALELVLSDQEGRTQSRFRRDYSLSVELRGVDDGRDHPIPLAFDCAIRALATTTPADFLAFLDAEQARDSETVQRYLVRGLTAGLPHTRERALAFLVEDRRRFELGPFSDQYQDSLALLAVLSPLLSDDELARLEQAVLEWNPIDGHMDDAGMRRSAQRINRLHRLRVLTALPFHRLSPPTQNLIGQERVRFPDHAEAGVNEIRGGFIGSPVSAAQMEKAKNPDIVKLFEELTDATGHTHPRDALQGGSIQAAREFGAFAKSHPARAAALVAGFRAGHQERPAGEALVGIADTDYPDADFFDLVISLDARGFRSEEFRVDAARSVRRRCRDNVGLPDRVCALLERWLDDDWDLSEGGGLHPDRRNSDRPESVLWAQGSYTLPNGTFTVLNALTYGYLCRQPPAGDRWLALLTAHLERPESTNTWQVLSVEFRYMHHCPQGAMICFLDRLFERHPGVLNGWFGARLITSIWRFAPEGDLWRWLTLLRTTGWEYAAQAYGELIQLRASAFEDPRALAEVREILRPESQVADAAGVRLGVALACVHLWSDTGARRLVTDAILALLPIAVGPLGQAVADLFTFSRDFPPDDNTGRLLAGFVAYPAALAHLRDGWITEHLANILPAEADCVFRLCQELIRIRRTELGTLASGWSMHAANLTAVALTLQRLDSPHRERGLELFECLLEAGLPDAVATLNEIDRRIPSPAVGLMPPRPRRRRRSQAA